MHTPGSRSRFSVLAAEVLFPNQYCWFVLLASLDLMLTGVILAIGGRELNIVAHQVLGVAGLGGLTVYKLAIVCCVVAICEFIGRRKPVTGRRLAEWSVALTSIPVAVAFAQLLVRAALAGPG